MGEISMSGSTREGGAAVIGLRASHPVLSPLLYWLNRQFMEVLRTPGGARSASYNFLALFSDTPV